MGNILECSGRGDTRKRWGAHGRWRMLSLWAEGEDVSGGRRRGDVSSELRSEAGGVKFGYKGYVYAVSRSHQEFDFVHV